MAGPNNRGAFSEKNWLLRKFYNEKFQKGPLCKKLKFQSTNNSDLGLIYTWNPEHRFQILNPLLNL